VNQGVNRANGFEEKLEELRNLLGLAHIAGASNRPASSGLDETHGLGQAIRIPAADGYLHAFRGEAERDAAADPAATPGDQKGLAIEIRETRRFLDDVTQVK
jgi:hypothetical protein